MCVGVPIHTHMMWHEKSWDDYSGLEIRGCRGLPWILQRLPQIFSGSTKCTGFYTQQMAFEDAIWLPGKILIWRPVLLFCRNIQLCLSGATQETPRGGAALCPEAHHPHQPPLPYREWATLPAGNRVRLLALMMLRLLSSHAQECKKIYWNHLNPVMLVFIWKLLLSSTIRWVPMCQGFSHFPAFCFHFMLTRLATSSKRVRVASSRVWMRRDFLYRVIKKKD